MAQVAHSDAPQRRVTLFPGESVADAAREAIAFGADALARSRAAAESGEAEPLHQFRVTTRRLRASIELFSVVLYASQLRLFRRDLAWISAQAGAVRECDVTATLIEERTAKIEPELARAITPMIEALRARRSEEHATLRALLESKRYRGLTDRLSRPALKKVGGDRKLGIAAPQLLRAAGRAATRQGERLAQDAPAIVFHKLRVRIKRLRYSLEMMAPLGAKRHKKALARLEELQELLGLYHDVTVCAEWLLAYAESAGAPLRTVMAAGALIQSLAAREAKLRRRCRRQWRRFERSEIVHETFDEIRRAGRLALMPASSSAIDAATDPRNGEAPSASQIDDSEHASENAVGATNEHSATEMRP
ncbi:MAG TPA: CHAD domain-containing protein [Candidatus Acidoferrales bacterium]|nr:CHAD domain-containing protein [Candidatus Acidoferrales bacterium]